MFNNFTLTNTPKHLKNLLITIAVFSLIPCIIHSLAAYLGLSLVGFSKAFFWQPITFLFMQPNMLSISFNSILQLFFYVFAIYTVGSEIISHKGVKSFYILFLLPGIISGLFLLGMMFLIKTSFIVYGLAIPTYSLLAGYIMLGTNARILIFHSAPIKISNIIIAIFCIHLFSIAANFSILIALAHLLAVAISYIYCLWSWKTHSPFKKLFKFEKIIIKKSHKAEFYDFASGSKMTDAQIVDEILDNSNEKGLNKKDKAKLKKFFQRKD